MQIALAVFDRNEPKIEAFGQSCTRVAIAVIVICAPVFLVVGPSAPGNADQGPIAEAKAQIKQFETSLVAYRITFRTLPGSLEGLLHPPSGDSIMAVRSQPMQSTTKFTKDTK